MQAQQISIVLYEACRFSRSLQCLYQTCRLSLISIVCIRDLQAQLDLYSVYTRPVGSVGSLLCLYQTCRLSWISIVCIRDLQAQLDLYSVYTRPVGSLGSLQCLYETSRLSWIPMVFIRDLQARLDLFSVYTRPVGSVDLYSVYTRHVGSLGSLQCLYETCRLSWIQIVFIRDLQAQLDPNSVYTRPVGSIASLQSLYETCRLSRSLQCLYETCRLTLISRVSIRDLQAQQISIVFIRDMQAQLDPNSVYTRHVGSVGSQQCLYEICGLNCISIVFIRDLQAHFDLYSGYTRPVGSVGSQQCVCETCRLSRFQQCFYETCRLSRSLQCLYETCGLSWIPMVFIRDLQAQLDPNSAYSRPVGSVGSLQCLYETCMLSRSLWCLFETCRLTWISIVFIRDLQAQLDPNNVQARPVGSVDLYSVDTRHVGSFGSLQCLYETCRLSWIPIVFMRDLQAQLVPNSVYTRPVGSVDLCSVYTRLVGSVGSQQCVYETSRLSWISIMFIRDMLAHLDLYSVYT